MAGRGTLAPVWRFGPAICGAGLILLAAGCGPVTPARAASLCEDEVNRALDSRSRVTVGIGTNSGPSVSAQVRLGADPLGGMSADDAYAACVIDRTGADPIRPFRREL